jgi:hypothetical protein
VDGAIAHNDAEVIKDHIALILSASKDLEAGASEAIDHASMNDKLRELEGYLISLEYRIKDKFSEQ